MYFLLILTMLPLPVSNYFCLVLEGDSGRERSVRVSLPFLPQVDGRARAGEIIRGDLFWLGFIDSSLWSMPVV